MNELVERLSAKKQIIEASRPEKTVKALKDSIDRKYVHILFKNTGTELGIKLDEANCKLDSADFEKENGQVHLEGILTLNFDKVRCVTDINLKTLEGEGILLPINETDYDQILNQD